MRRGKRGRGGRGRRDEGRGDPPSGRPSRHLPAAAVVAVAAVAAAAALRKPCPVAGHHGNGTAEFRGRRAARPDPRPRERAHLHRECLRSDTHGAREERTGRRGSGRGGRGGPSLRGDPPVLPPEPGAAPSAESAHSPGVLEVARVGKLATARGVAVDSRRRAAGPSHLLKMPCADPDPVPPEYMASALPCPALPSSSSSQQRCASLLVICSQLGIAFSSPALPGSSVSPIPSGVPKSFNYAECFSMSVPNIPYPDLSEILDYFKR